MIQLNRILLSTDFSPHSASAAQYAFAFAEKFNSQVHVLHVQEQIPGTAPDFVMGIAIPSHIEESEQASLQGIARFLTEGGWNIADVVPATTRGTPFVEIVRYAKNHEIDLIVMGTHGRSALAHVLMGSVAERVVRKAPCPVMTIRPEGHQFVMP